MLKWKMNLLSVLTLFGLAFLPASAFAADPAKTIVAHLPAGRPLPQADGLVYAADGTTVLMSYPLTLEWFTFPGMGGEEEQTISFMNAQGVLQTKTVKVSSARWPGRDSGYVVVDGNAIAAKVGQCNNAGCPCGDDCKCLPGKPCPVTGVPFNSITWWTGPNGPEFVELIAQESVFTGAFNGGSIAINRRVGAAAELGKVRASFTLDGKPATAEQVRQWGATHVDCRVTEHSDGSLAFSGGRLVYNATAGQTSQPTYYAPAAGCPTCPNGNCPLPRTRR